MSRWRYDPELDEVVEVGAPRLDKKGEWKQPMHCEGVAVDPAEIPKWKEFDRVNGLGDTTYDANGCPVFRDAGEYNRYLKAHGYINKTSGRGHSALAPGQLEQAIERAKSA